ncbi:MAG TPA: 5-oxoprolinase subunit PxpB [Dokdonella sp.]
MDVITSDDWSAEPAGEALLLLRFGSTLDAALNARVHALAEALRDARLDGIVDIVPAYASLGIHYEPRAWEGRDGAPWRRLAGAVRACAREAPARRAARQVQVPVRYGGDDGPDLERVARHAGLEAIEVVRRHAAAAYRVAMLGFAPGFPYLIGLDPALQIARRAEPRLRVPAGAVAIGGLQTGIYPRELPGGWNLIGRTPLALFDARAEPPCLLAPGDVVRFHALS